MFLAVCLCQFCTIVILIEAGEARSSSLVSTQATGLEFVREWYEMVITHYIKGSDVTFQAAIYPGSQVLLGVLIGLILIF